MAKQLIVFTLSIFVATTVFADDSIDLDLEVLALLAENDVDEFSDASEPDTDLEEEAEIDLGDDMSEEEMLPPEEEDDLAADEDAPQPPGYEEADAQHAKPKVADAVAEKPAPKPVKQKAVVKKKKAHKKKVAKSGFKRLKSNCYMRSIASVKGKPIKTLKRGKKLWTESHDGEWTKVFRKKGVAYISNKCF